MYFQMYSAPAYEFKYKNPRNHNDKKFNFFVKLKIFQIQKIFFRQISEAISNRSTRVYINIYTYTSMI